MHFDDSIGDLFHHLIHIIVLLLVGFIIMWATLYWLTWTTGKECAARAMTDVQAHMRQYGVISESKLDESINKYCTGSGFKGYEVVEVTPGFNSRPQYLGQPMYVEVVVTYHIFARDINIGARADIGNSGYYGNGYNTKSEV